jgi:glutaredoxin 3
MLMGGMIWQEATYSLKKSTALRRLCTARAVASASRSTISTGCSVSAAATVRAGAVTPYEPEVRQMHKVKVYSTPTCPWCVRAKEFLKQSDVKFEDVDVSKDAAQAKEMIQKSGQRGVPVLDIDGTIIIGFDKPAIEQALGKA